MRISSGEHLPIKLVDKITQEKIVKIVDQIINAKEKGPKTDTSALEKEIDKLVYAIYGLTPEEIAFVEGQGECFE